MIFTARRRRFVGLAVLALAIGVATLAYGRLGLPGRFVRGHLGDVAATMLVYALLGLAWRGRWPWRAALSFGIASAIELGQLVWTGTGVAGEIVVGSVFDPWDLVAYAAGTLIGVVWERRASSAGATLAA